MRAIGRQQSLPRDRRDLATSGQWLVQIASLADRDAAEALATALAGHAELAGQRYRVRLGPFSSLVDAQRARDGAVRAGYGDALIVHPS